MTSIHDPAPYGPVPTERQLRWHALEYYGFLHFTVNTFTDLEWGYGDESPSVFDPTQFDAERIVSVAASGGMAGLILTCKHHDGFCLWPSEHTDHSVRTSPWRSGGGDVVRAISEACASRGLEFGVYLSPWDRNHRAYGSGEYLRYYRNQLEELLTRYGPVFEVWFDGANGGDGYYGGARETRRIDPRTYYEWQTTWDLVRSLQPDACMFSDVGPDIRWVGNEKGIAGDPCWHTTDVGDEAPGSADSARLNGGVRSGARWLPAECDVSIRPGWFYHESEDGAVRTPENLFDLYLRSVGRGASLLLNLPPDRRGLIHENDARSLDEFGKRLRSVFARNVAADARIEASNVRGDHPRFDVGNLVDGHGETFWSTDDGLSEAEIVVHLPETSRFNIVEMREHLPLGQRVERYVVETEDRSGRREYASGSAIGNRRLIRGEERTGGRVRLKLLGLPAAPALSGFGLYYDPA